MPNSSFLYIPSSLDTLALLPKELKKHCDKFNYVLHSIYQARITDKRNSFEDYISLSSKILEEILGSRLYKDVLEFWIENDVIETDNQYIVGEKSKGYRFTAAYKKIRVKQVPLKDYRFRSKLDKRKTAYKSSINPSDKALSFLNDNLLSLRIDEVGALTYTSSLFNEDAEDTDKFNQYQASIGKFAQKDYFFKRDNVGFRVHNNFVNFPKQLRQFLYIESGEQLANIDIANSQPLMLCALLNDYYNGKSLPEDVVRYISECETGVFYESFASVSSISLDDRKAFKEKLFEDVFFGSNNACKRSKAFKALSKHYPSVADFITDYKKEDYARLAIALQKVESSIIIDDVITSIADKYSADNFFALTIHDSITTTLSNRDEVADLIQQAFIKREIRASLKYELFEPDALPEKEEAQS